MRKATIIEDRFEDFKIEFIVYDNRTRIALFCPENLKEKVNWSVRMFDGMYHLSDAFEQKKIIIKLTDVDFDERDAFRTEHEYDMWINRKYDEVEYIYSWEI